MEARFVSIKRVISLIEDITQEREYQKSMASILNLIIEGEKKLHTSETFDDQDFKWIAPTGYASRYAPIPKDALWVKHIWVNGTKLKRSDAGSVNLVSCNEFKTTANKVWFSFIPSEVVFSCAVIALDENCMPMVNENHVEALAWYVVYHFDYAEYRKQNLPQAIMLNTEQRKNKAMRQARGSDNMIHWMENRTINQKMMNAFSMTNVETNWKGSFPSE